MHFSQKIFFCQIIFFLLKNWILSLPRNIFSTKELNIFYQRIFVLLRNEIFFPRRNQIFPAKEFFVCKGIFFLPRNILSTKESKYFLTYESNFDHSNLAPLKSAEKIKVNSWNGWVTFWLRRSYFRSQSNIRLADKNGKNPATQLSTWALKPIVGAQKSFPETNLSVHDLLPIPKRRWSRTNNIFLHLR